MTTRDLWTLVGRWALDDSFVEQWNDNPAKAITRADYSLDSEEVKIALETTDYYGYKPPSNWLAVGRAIFDDDFRNQLLDEPLAAIEAAGFELMDGELETIVDAARQHIKHTPDFWLAAGRAAIDEPWGEELLSDPDRALKEASYELNEKELAAVIDVTKKLFKEAPDAWIAAGRAACFDPFREVLLKDPQTTLKREGYELTDEEQDRVLQSAKLLRHPVSDDVVVTGRAAMDAYFRKRLLDDPDSALAEYGYQLGRQERDAVLDSAAALENNVPDGWIAGGRAMMDEVFAQKLVSDSDTALREHGYSLDSGEKEFVVSQTQKLLEAYQQNQKVMQESQEWGFNLVKGTLDSAAKTFRAISMMNKIMFGVGIALFVAAAISGVFNGKEGSTLLLGGLGAATFVTLFMTDPIRRSQVALSNLVQVDVAFMNFLDQTGMWQEYAMRSSKVPALGAPAIEKASQAMHERATQTIELLQRYVEGDGDSTTGGGKTVVRRLALRRR